MYEDLKKRNSFGPSDPVSSDGEKLDPRASESANRIFLVVILYFLN